MNRSQGSRIAVSSGRESGGKTREARSGPPPTERSGKEHRMGTRVGPKGMPRPWLPRYLAIFLGVPHRRVQRCRHITWAEVRIRILLYGQTAPGNWHDPRRMAPLLDERATEHPAPSTPNGIRTRVVAVKGRCPRPLDDGGRFDGYSRPVPRLCAPIGQLTGRLRGPWLVRVVRAAPPRPLRVDGRCRPRSTARQPPPPGSHRVGGPRPAARAGG